jgi:hypothetical protein
MTEPARQRSRVRSFLLGGVVGAFAVLATRRRQHPVTATTSGLAAFEAAPCFKETLERQRKR